MYLFAEVIFYSGQRKHLPAIMKFSFQDHYQEGAPNQLFEIMEGAKQVGVGKIISVEYD